MKKTYLYKKTHKITGLKYLGKTVSSDPHKYRGSGKRWLNHINKHGYDVDTEILRECFSKEEVTQWGLYYSNLWNIVEERNEFGKKTWANIRPEAGDGGDTSMSEGYKKALANRDMSGIKNPMFGKVSNSKGKTYEELYGAEKAAELKLLAKERSTGRKLEQHSIDKQAASLSKTTKGRPKPQSFKDKLKKQKTEEHKQKLRGPRAKMQCPHCLMIGGISQMKRWHFNNCKKATTENNI